jgi:cephalosporin hydroxylase
MITIDQDRVTVIAADGTRQELAIGSPQGFELLSRLWLRSGWDAKYVYSFTWLGRPILQLPEDMIRIQEVIYRLQPDVIVETGIAHGGSLVFYAGLCKLLDRGKVVGVDREIRPHNRQALEVHPLRRYLTLIEGDSIDPAVVRRVQAQVQPGQTVLVLLDSCHTRSHVLSELCAYAPLVSRGSYLVAMDGIMEEVAGAPRTNPDWTWNNPKRAVLEFVKEHPEFVIEEPAFLFNEGTVRQRVTYWPSAFARRVRETP